MYELRKKQKEERENFVEKALRQVQKTTVVSDSNQSYEMGRIVSDANRHSHDSNRSTPDLIRESSQHVSAPQMGFKAGLHEINQGEPGEKKPTLSSKNLKLNELTMKQIYSMSRTRVKSTMMNTKTDAKVSRPSLNQLKLTQQQQMAYASTNKPKAGGSVMSNQHQSNSHSDMKQVTEPAKTEYWVIRKPDTNAVCTSLDTAVGYNLANMQSSTAAAPYTTHSNQGTPVTHVTQYPTTHLPVTCSTQSSMSVIAVHEPGPSTSYASGQGSSMSDPWYKNNTMK